MFARGILAISLLLASSSGVAKKLYKYQDAEGTWFFTDQAPASNQPVAVRQLKAANPKRVWLEKTADDLQPSFFALNAYPGPIELAVDWRERENVSANPDLPRRFVVESGQSGSLFSLIPNQSAGFYSVNLQYSYVVGRPLPGYVSQTLYKPPLPAGAQFQITQAFNGPYSHNDEQNRYAVDIMMPVDTPVYAARGGIVLEVENDYTSHGTSQAYASKANSIRILHEDGSMAVYAHLALEKAQVTPGMRVATGQLIAYSGNTGLTTGPHLHFAVQINRGMELISVPFQFTDENGLAVEPKLGLWLSGPAATVGN
ncbi:peptidoglycan DD-metalloendopeptidase family protein [Methylomonas sp. ZR1]|uniref:peptidoglycan DD-metalloendopeptidase family protein n=1 Tax=Methylomonas sp. ZR1 TaxID=1797072 RepID=UPI001490DA33|nr:M23 family metallopeptidase [Methylomonas sp. ZR1]